MLSKFPKITPLIGDIGDLNPGLFIAEALGKAEAGGYRTRVSGEMVYFLLSPAAGQRYNSHELDSGLEIASSHTLSLISQFSWLGLAQ